MLHEILFALLGKPGNIIKENENSFEIDNNIQFLSQSEKEIINKLCILGFYFRRIEQFLEENYQSFQKIASLVKYKNGENDEENEDPLADQNIIGNSAYIKVSMQKPVELNSLTFTYIILQLILNLI